MRPSGGCWSFWSAPDAGVSGSSATARPARAALSSTTAASAPTLSSNTADRNPYKHGKLLLGTRIPIYPLERIRETCPESVLILPWNLKDDVIEQPSYIRNWGGQFVVPIPDVKVYP